MEAKYRQYFHLCLYLYLRQVRKKRPKNSFTRNDVINFICEKLSINYQATFSGYLLDEALEELVARGLIGRYSDDLTEDYFYLNSEEYDELEAFMVGDVNKLEVYQQLDFRGDRWLGEALIALEQRAAQEEQNRVADEAKSLEADSDGDPLSTEEWKPLPIDRDSDAYRGAMDAVEAAAEVIEGSNGYAESEPEERNGIVHTIRGTLRAVKEGLPSRKSIVQGLLVPLRFISTKFAGAAMGEVAKKAVAALTTRLLGS